MRAQKWNRRISLAAGCVASLALWLGGASAASAQEDDPDTDTSGSYTYTVDPEAGVVRVDLQYAFTADKPNRSSSRGTTQYYFTGSFVTIPKNATELTVTDNGRALEFERYDDNEFADVVEFGFRRNVFYRQTADITITYALPGSEPRSEDTARVNPAYAGFEVWADPGIETTDVRVEYPAEMELDQRRLFFTGLQTVETDDPAVEAVARTDIGIDDFFFAFLSMRNDDALVATTVDVGDVEVELQAWPGDDEWSRFVEEQLDDAFPDLVELVGIDWPVEGTLVIQESYSPLLAGYGGWFDTDTDVIEVGDELDDSLILHELSHAWFNRNLVNGRWITEGLAEEFAAAAVAGDDRDPEDPPRVSLLDDEAFPLAEWTNSQGPEEEGWAYQASWVVTRAITDEVGIEVLADVVAALDANELSYLGEAEPEQYEGPSRHWRLYLDLLEERGETDELAELFETWVAPSRFIPDMEDRAAARVRYAELEEAGDSWAVPLVIRRDMSEWDFDTAVELIDAAEAVLAERERALTAVDGLDVELPPDAEEEYQAATDSLDEALETAVAVADAAETLAAVEVAADAQQPFLTRIGLIGSDLDVFVADASVAFESGDLEAVSEDAAGLDEAVADAEQAGRVRVAAAGLVVLAVVGAIVILRRRRRSSEPEESAIESGDGVSNEPESDDADITAAVDDHESVGAAVGGGPPDAASGTAGVETPRG